MKYASNKKDYPICKTSKDLKPFSESVRCSHPKRESSDKALDGLFSLIQMDKGYFKIWRKLREHPIWQDHFCLIVFLYCLNHAEWKEGRKTVFKKEQITLNRGQLSSGRFQIAKEMRLPPSTVRNCLKRLVSTYEILDIKSDNKLSIITILNWDRYQSKENLEDFKEDNERTSVGQREDTPEALNHLRIKKKALPNFSKKIETTIRNNSNQKRFSYPPEIKNLVQETMSKLK